MRRPGLKCRHPHINVIYLLLKVLFLLRPGGLPLGQLALEVLTVALPLLTIKVRTLLSSMEVPGNGSVEA